MYEPSLHDRIAGSAPLRRRQRLGRGAASVLGRISVTGLEHVPPSGPVVVAMNHSSFIDGPVLFGHLARPVSFLVKTEAFVGPLAPVLRGAGQIGVRRFTVDPAPIRLGLQILRAGGILGIFPEGTRGDGSVRTIRPGVAYFALRSGAVVLPVSAHGTAALTHWHGPRRPAASVTIGEPIPVPRWPDEQRLNRRTVAALAERLRLELAGLVERCAPTVEREAA